MFATKFVSVTASEQLIGAESSAQKVLHKIIWGKAKAFLLTFPDNSIGGLTLATTGDPNG